MAYQERILKLQQLEVRKVYTPNIIRDDEPVKIMLNYKLMCILSYLNPIIFREKSSDK